MPRFGDFVKAPAPGRPAAILGLVYNLQIQDDAFVRPLAVAPDLSPEYVLDQRRNRHVPVEVSVLAVGYRDGEAVVQGLPPQPPLTLDHIHLCAPDEVAAFTERLDFLRLIVDAPDVPADELLAEAVRGAVQARPAEARAAYQRRAGRELARLMVRDLPRLERLLRRLRA